MANSVTHFEIFASDVERARKFYERVFGWRFEIAGPPDFYLIFTGSESDPGLIRGLITKRHGPAPGGGLSGFRCTVSVSSITESVAAIEAAGGKIRSAIVHVPGVGQLAEFSDTDGNIACAMEYGKDLSLAVRQGMP